MTAAQGRGVEVSVRNMQRRLPVDTRRIRRLAVHALSKLGREGVQVSIVIVGDRRMRQLNRRYRGYGSATDVLAFSQEEGAGPVETDLLGDVVVSAETAARQAEARKRPLEREIDLLVVHGLLHLAGLDHTRPGEERRTMQSWQRRILRSWEG